jgi:hypothetical protein
MLTEAIKAKITELFNSTSEGVSVGYGKKITNGQYTGEVGIVFHVEKKLPLSEIPENEVLPSSVNIDGVEYVTDVIAAGKFTIAACDPSCYTWQNPATPPGNRNKIRPLKGGISMTSFNNLGTVGTLGFIAVDVATQALVGVTNNHVACGDHFYTYFRNYTNGFPTNEVNEDVYQNGESSNISDPSYVIGKVVRYIPLSTVGNTVDGALVSVKAEDISLTESFKQFGLNYNLPMAFATTAEIDNLLTTDPPLYSSGRTTGVKGPAPCQLTIGAIGQSLDIAYSNQGQEGALAGFENCMLFTRTDPTCADPITGGDSGSALIADFNGVWKIIGLVFAKGSFVDAGITYYLGIANRIDDVASQLGIQAWDGTAKNYIDNDSFEYKTTPGGSLNKILSCGGSTYWQMGLTDQSLPC